MQSRTIGRRLCPRIGREVVIASSVRIEGDVIIGDDTRIDPFVVIKSGTRIGSGCQIETGAVLGVRPQDKNFKNEKSYLVIGDGCQIREYATLSLATGRGRKTTIGPDSMIMSYCHIAHNVSIGKSVVITSGSQIGGHVEIGDSAMVGGLCGIHQFCRVGRLSMLGACSYLNTDLPPFCLAQGNPARFYGINEIGLSRVGISKEKRNEISSCLKTIYRFGPKGKILKDLIKNYPIAEVRELVGFFSVSKRSITRPF